MSTLIPLFASILPFLLWPVELFLPYPHIIEELAKTGLVVWILNTSEKSKTWKLVSISGLLFAISETVLYIFNISATGGTQTLLFRLALTIPLHVITSLIILGSAIRKRGLMVFGVLISMIIHFIFNLSVGLQPTH